MIMAIVNHGRNPEIHKGLIRPWKSKDYLLNGFSEKTIILVGIYNQQFQGTIILMVFDLQGRV